MHSHPESAQPRYDLVLTGGTVVTLDGNRRVIEPGAVAVSGDRIVAVDAADRIDAAAANRVVDCKGAVVLPGFVDCHSHLAQMLIKSLGEGLTTWDWLSTLTFPVTDAVRRDEVVAGTRLAALRRSGPVSPAWPTTSTCPPIPRPRSRWPARWSRWASAARSPGG